MHRYIQHYSKSHELMLYVLSNLSLNITIFNTVNQGHNTIPYEKKKLMLYTHFLNFLYDQPLRTARRGEAPPACDWNSLQQDLPGSTQENRFARNHSLRKCLACRGPAPNKARRWCYRRETRGTLYMFSKRWCPGL